MPIDSSKIPWVSRIIFKKADPFEIASYAIYLQSLLFYDQAACTDNFFFFFDHQNINAIDNIRDINQ